MFKTHQRTNNLQGIIYKTSTFESCCHGIFRAISTRSFFYNIVMQPLCIRVGVQSQFLANCIQFPCSQKETRFAPLGDNGGGDNNWILNADMSNFQS